jgi:hypothetical protein
MQFSHLVLISMLALRAESAAMPQSKEYNPNENTFCDNFRWKSGQAWILQATCDPVTSDGDKTRYDYEVDLYQCIGVGMDGKLIWRWA